MVAGRSRDRLRVDARERTVGLGRQCGRWIAAQSRHRHRPCRRAVVEPRQSDRLPRDERQREPVRGQRPADHRRRERVRLPRLVGLADRLLLRFRRQDPQAGAHWPRANRRVHRDDAGDAAAVHTARARLHDDDAAAGARDRAAGDLAGRNTDRLRSGWRYLRHAGRRQAREHHQRFGARHRSVVVAGWHAARVLVRQGQPAAPALGARHEERAEPPGDAHQHAAARCELLTGWQAHRVLQRRRHVARGGNVGARSRQRHRHPDSRLAAAAGHADLVAGWRACRACRRRAAVDAVPRRHQPGADDPGRWQGRRQVVRAGAAPLHRHARRRRSGVVAGRHQDGCDLRRGAVGVAGVAGGRTARAAAARHVRERTLAKLAG